ncbi:aminotransferase class I/II-fold pyridoxal phosphate-dependent enzyme [Candidatus Desantisbacteria bacterium]|nr:aminotransferase class I/II-fold pyridoxal phosphate-dependent enzyme [Candidatus Desantisbacteria bacterium]
MFVEIKIDNEDIKGKIYNISEQGFKVISDKSIPISRKIDYLITLPDKKYVQGKGRIIWILEKSIKEFCYGIIFIKWNEEYDADMFNEYLNNISSNKKIDERRDKFERRKNNLGTPEDKRKIERRLVKGVFRKCINSKIVHEFLSQEKICFFRELSTASADRIIINKKEMINLGSNNYLGLTTHPKVKEAAIKAIEKYGTGSGGVRILSGTLDLHNQLEYKLAKFKGGEDCVVYSTGYTTNIGTISGLLGKEDVVIIDEKAHASIIDGCNLSGAELLIFNHNDMIDLEKKLKKYGEEKNKLIITDGVFSMDGDIAELDKIYILAQEYNSAVMIDDAHATGVIGEKGKGTSEYFNLMGKIDIIGGTLSKALGSIGGFIAGNKKIIQYLKNTGSRSFLFTTSLPPSVSAGIITAIDVIENEPEIRKQLWANIAFMKDGMKKLGFNIRNTESAIIPIIVGENKKTFKMTEMLGEKGVFVSSVVYPAVKRNESRLRISIMATHTLADLEISLNALEKAGKKIGII